MFKMEDTTILIKIKMRKLGWSKFQNIKAEMKSHKSLKNFYIEKLSAQNQYPTNNYLFTYVFIVIFKLVL